MMPEVSFAVLVAVTAVALLAGVVLGAVDRDKGMSHPEFRRTLEAAGLLSVLLFPLAALALLGKERAPAFDGPMMGPEGRLVDPHGVVSS